MPLGLYLHFPFCRKHCSYCDFYKLLYNEQLEKKYFDALMIETELAARALPDPSRIVSTIFIGGGTPSMGSRGLLLRWLEQLRDLFEIPPGTEFSIECNPESIDIDKLQFLKDAGVNRPTFGVQSFNKEALALLERRHSPHHVQRAIYNVNALGITNYGVDLIFGLPGQNTSKLAADIEQLLELGAPHISYYQLTVEPSTKLAAKIKKGKLRLPDDDLMHALYRIGVERMAEAGYARYEVSSFAKPGHECRHNMSYWNGSDYLGLGPSAHSFINGERFANVPNLTEYINQLSERKLPRVVDVSGINDRANEAIMLGLRTTDGIDLDKFTRRFGLAIEDRIDQKQYEILLESGHLVREQRSLRLSDEGMYLADEIMGRLVL